MAARYLGMSKTTFLRRAGKDLPAGKKDGPRMVFWDKVVLDEWVNAWSGLSTGSGGVHKPW